MEVPGRVRLARKGMWKRNNSRTVQFKAQNYSPRPSVTSEVIALLQCRTLFGDASLVLLVLGLLIYQLLS